MKNRTIFLVLFLSLQFSLLSCFDPGSDYKDRISTIDTITVPDSVQLGNPIEVSFITKGSNGCWRKGHDVVDRNSGVYRITPYDREYIGPNICPAVIVNFLHEISLSTIVGGVQKIEILHRLRSSAGQDSVGVFLREVVVYQYDGSTNPQAKIK